MEGRRPITVSHPTERLVGESSGICAVRAQIRHLARFDTLGKPEVPTVLLLGETGTGKGLVARIMHDSGPRTQGPFIDVNCAAIPETLLEAELFGFEAGTFTDAKRAKPGLFEAASGGTLFLDEMDALPLALQGKLLVVLEEKRVRRLGTVTARAVDVKVIVAAQRELGGLVAAGQFRADLYYRLAVLFVEISRLRERGQDVLVLAEHFLRRSAAAHALMPKELSAAAAVWLQGYPWPGNVRELSHLMERATLLSPERLLTPATLEQLCLPQPRPLWPAPSEPDREVQAPVDARARIVEALQRTGGNVARAARLLGVTRSALRRRMHRYGLARPGEEESLPPPPPVVGRGAGATAEIPEGRNTARALAPGTQSASQDSGWEQKPVAVLAIDLSWPEVTGLETSRYAPWTVMARWEQALVEKVEAFGGILVQRTPALLMAAFGIPQTLEQLPQRAVQAALAIRSLLTEPQTTERGEPVPEVRLAVHWGQILVEGEARDPMEHPVVMGETLARPVRLLGHAEPSEILVSPEVGRLLEGWFELQARTVIREGEPAGRRIAYVVRGLDARRLARAGLGTRVLSRFVGRDGELTTLAQLQARAAAGAGQVVGIVGEPGIGKSRLLYECRQRLMGAGVLALEGHCLSYGTTIPYLPVRDLLKTYFRIEDHDDAQRMHAQVVGTLRALDEATGWTLPALLALLDLSGEDAQWQALEPPQRRQHTLEAVKRLLLRESQRQPLVLVFENLHWVDAETQALLAGLFESLPTARMLLLVTYRPEYQHGWGNRTYYTQLRLDPLPRDRTGALLDTLLGDDVALAPLKQLVLDRTQGNPLFMEESVQSLVETQLLVGARGAYRLAQELRRIQVPATVQAILAARIDRLRPEAKRLVQAAAVIGTEVPLALLQAVAEFPEEVLRRGLMHLQTTEFLYETSLFPECKYTFKHALTHEVAYGSLAQERRRALHARIMEAMEALYADHLTEQIERLAYHACQGEVWPKAMEYSTLAGDRAADAFANEEARAHYTRALQAAEQLTPPPNPGVVARLYAKHAAILERLGEYAAAVVAYQRALELMRQVGDRRGEIDVLVGLSGVYNNAHCEEPATTTSEQALTLARQLGDRACLAVCLVQRAVIRSVAYGQIVEATPDAEEALHLTSDIGEPKALAQTLLFLGTLLQFRAEFDRGLAYLHEGIELAQHMHAGHLVGHAAFCIGNASAAQGAYEEALRWYQQLSDYASAASDTFWIARVPNLIGGVHLELFDLDEALRLNLEGDEVAQRLFPWPEPRGHSLVKAGLVYLQQGEHGRAAATFRAAAALLDADAWMRWRWHMVLLRALGELALAEGRHEEAWTYATQSLELARQSDSRKHMARAQLLQGDVLIRHGRLEDAAQTLQASICLAEQIGTPREVWLGKATLGKVLLRLGREQEAEAQFIQATQTIAAIAANLRTPRLRHSFLSAAPVLEVYAALGHCPPPATL